jgi:hypothetical protein
MITVNTRKKENFKDTLDKNIIACDVERPLNV